ncbi:hypothetical protein [Pseudomonas sp. NFACC37-1]|uniref:hypothetical protein n=1 Tax=Pseudomonas sp. NFACC37-1 TaxID=1566196 RepID=UPI0008890A3F|nr:hypothetical protein [Pseudomonas sp. NFACC37-1]SCY64616.1 hypothetical protein SAMN03159391_02500 [Pseudomonas sp. NFACC37-1]
MKEMKRNIEPLSKAVVIAVGAMLIAGCPSKSLEPGAVAMQWATNVSQMGVHPFYPLREDVFPGDIYLVPAHSAGNLASKKIPTRFYKIPPVYLASLNVCDLYKEMKKRPRMPTTTTYKLKDNDITPWSPPDFKLSHTGCDLDGQTDFAIGRTVSFPAFTFASLSESKLGANVITGGVGALFGGGRKDQYYVTVSVPVAESITTQSTDIYRKFVGTYDTNPADSTKAADIKNLILLIKNSNNNAGGSEVSISTALALITDVYYARVIDVSISASDSYSGQLSATALSLIERSEKLSKLRDSLAGLKAEVPENNKVEEARQQSISDLNERIAIEAQEIAALSQMAIPNAPGITGSVTRSSSTGVTLTQVLPKPVAIGYRAIMLDAKDFTEGKYTIIPGNSDVGPAFVEEREGS